MPYPNHPSFHLPRMPLLQAAAGPGIPRDTGSGIAAVSIGEHTRRVAETAHARATAPFRIASSLRGPDSGQAIQKLLLLARSRSCASRTCLIAIAAPIGDVRGDIAS